MKISDLTFSTDELSSDIALVERVCQIAYRRKNDSTLDNRQLFLLGYNEHDCFLIENKMNLINSMSILL